MGRAMDVRDIRPFRWIRVPEPDISLDEFLRNPTSGSTIRALFDVFNTSETAEWRTRILNSRAIYDPYVGQVLEEWLAAGMGGEGHRRRQVPLIEVINVEGDDGSSGDGQRRQEPVIEVIDVEDDDGGGEEDGRPQQPMIEVINVEDSDDDEPPHMVQRRPTLDVDRMQALDIQMHCPSLRTPVDSNDENDDYEAIVAGPSSGFRNVAVLPNDVENVTQRKMVTRSQMTDAVSDAPVARRTRSRCGKMEQASRKGEEKRCRLRRLPSSMSGPISFSAGVSVLRLVASSALQQRKSRSVRKASTDASNRINTHFKGRKC